MAGAKVVRRPARSIHTNLCLVLVLLQCRSCSGSSSISSRRWNSDCSGLVGWRSVFQWRCLGRDEKEVDHARNEAQNCSSGENECPVTKVLLQMKRQKRSPESSQVGHGVTKRTQNSGLPDISFIQRSVAIEVRGF